MSMKALVFCVAVGLGAIASESLNARAIVDIDVAPPAPREEVVPAPRVGFVWAPGYWNWDGHKHVWALAIGRKIVPAIIGLPIVGASAMVTGITKRVIGIDSGCEHSARRLIRAGS